MKPLDFPEEEKPDPPATPPKVDVREFKHLNSPVANLILGAIIAGFGALVIVGSDPGSNDVAYFFFTFITGVAFMVVGIVRLFWEGYRGNRGNRGNAETTEKRRKF